jgi:hypothetical protein
MTAAPGSAPRAASSPVVRHLGLSDYATTRACAVHCCPYAGNPRRNLSPSIRRSIHWALPVARAPPADNGIEAIKVDRGGQVTHGPGQLVVYALLDLARARLRIRDTRTPLRGAVIRWLDALVWRRTQTGPPGVYTMLNGADAKIAALGLKVSRGCTYHGLSVNVAMDLAPSGYRPLPAGTAGWR